MLQALHTQTLTNTKQYERFEVFEETLSLTIKNFSKLFRTKEDVVSKFALFFIGQNEFGQFGVDKTENDSTSVKKLIKCPNHLISKIFPSNGYIILIIIIKIYGHPV